MQVNFLLALCGDGVVAELSATIPKEQFYNNLLNGKVRGRLLNIGEYNPQVEIETKLRFLAKELHSEKARSIFRERFRFQAVTFRIRICRLALFFGIINAYEKSANFDRGRKVLGPKIW